MKVVAVIVTYNPAEQLAQNISALRTQVDKIIIVDNNSSNKTVLQSLGAEVIYNAHNVGLATALNQGVRKALEAQATWVATFDQDSIASETFISDLLEAYRCCPYRDKVAIVAPVHRDQRSAKLTSRAGKKSQELYHPIAQTITSGCLTKASVFEQVGWFRDEFFIDFIDFEYCLRCLDHGFELIEARKAILLHNIGEASQHLLWGKTYTATNHSPLRRYYNARNRLLVYKKYWKTHAYWVVQSMVGFAREMVSILLFEKGRKEKFRYIAKGVWHGLLGQAGAYG